MLTRPESAGAPRTAPEEGTADVLLEVRDLEVHFALRGGFLQRMLGQDTGSVKAVDGVSFSLRRGEVLGLVGESGSGKTTLAKAVLCLVRPTAGSVLLEGETISTLSERHVRPLRRRMQPVFQDPHASLNPTMNLEEAVGHPLKIHHVGRTPEERRARVSEALERVGLVPVERFLAKYPSELSGGQRQRANIARAIILGPDLVVADEPVSMLDMSVRAKVLQLLVDLKRDLGLTYLYVTHDLATARFFCDRVAIMYLGRIVEIGSTDDLYRNPRHPYTRALLEAIPEPDPERRIPRRLPRGEVPDATVPPLGCAFHPRCREAFGPCGWESRDLRSLLEMRWAALGPEEFRKERDVLGDLSGLSAPSLDVHMPAAPGRSGSDVATLLAWHRAADPDEPLWKGVAHMEPGPAGVRVRFRDHADPVLEEGGTPASGMVACHLYRADLN
ncbi:MAG: ABC transporter ATP-binding protein [Acidimicrobiales bacterium]